MLSRIIFQTKDFVMNASRDQGEVVERMDSILCRLDQIEEKETKVIEELRNHLEARVKSAVHELSEHLKSDDVKARFTTWTSDEVPKEEGSWAVTSRNISKALENRLQEVIEHWEEKRQVFSAARKSLLQHCQQRYDMVVGQLKNLRCAVTNDDLAVSETSPPKTGFTTTEKVVIGVASPIWVPVSLVTLLIGVPVVGILDIVNRLVNRSRINKYRRDKCAFMATASADYLDEATNKSVLKVFVENQVNEAKLCLEKIETRIPELIEAYKILYKALGDVRRSQREKTKLYQPIVDQASYIRGQLAAFALKFLRVTDISSGELDWREDMPSRLGGGVSATVYQGKLRRHGEEKTVALKVCRQELDAHSASSIMAEVEILR